VELRAPSILDIGGNHKWQHNIILSIQTYRLSPHLPSKNLFFQESSALTEALLFSSALSLARCSAVKHPKATCSTHSRRALLKKELLRQSLVILRVVQWKVNERERQAGRGGGLSLPEPAKCDEPRGSVTLYEQGLTFERHTPATPPPRPFVPHNKIKKDSAGQVVSH
jgi:hypothetical protein